MEIRFDEGSIKKLTPHLGADKKLLLTFEDGVGPYSQHAMIHMQTQFSFNVVPASEATPDYEQTVDSNLGPVLIKGYSQEDLDPHMVVHFHPTTDTMALNGDGGEIDGNLGFIDFTEPNGIRDNPAR
ncbi:iron-sulfur cluster biosynthesis family protein [Lacticaseibacillus mingshuiensis]|uniref:Iron-sulfur cluster biosynthesis family protein n=1 Tax=Lacticaseibacillus mingshuiensis TaxID=2799574 RepID=A0ABW4CGM6_9LACO|nr:iron-sulfur cluster biosynthesis family protein [Lacticaseibacillus mingshuiensis]